MNKKRVNFTQEELNLLRNLVLKKPIIEKKLHDHKTESLRKLAWGEILIEFNAEGLNTNRTMDQIKGAWKRMKKDYKSQKAAERRSTFRTGGGPPSPVGEEDIAMDAMFSDQQPLENLPDDDDDYNEDDPEAGGLPLSRPASPKPGTPIAGSSTADTSRATTPTAQTQAPVPKTTVKRLASFAEQFHNKKMEYLKEEHELKMQAIEEEKTYWTLMKAIAQQSANTQEQGKSGGSSEAKTFQLLSGSIQDN